ncbi:MAG: RluA family pseudouridine synthase [Treponema sp.]|nr:RluA family pseudouridine synthase [Treponema sp.]
MELYTGDNDKGRRLDRILRKALPDHPLPLIHRLLRQKLVLVDGKPGKAGDRLDSGVKIFINSLKDKPINNISSRKDINIDQKSDKNQKKSDFKRFDRVKFDKKLIIWEGRGLLAVNKPVGLVVHGDNSLDSMVNSYLADKITPSLSFKPGPLHRLDKPSSGIVVFSVNIEGARLFSSLMREKKVQKTYLTIVEGKIEKDTIWQDELFRDKERQKTFISEHDSGKTAITNVTPLVTKNGYTLIKAEIITGRTHQIRAQAASHGHPLLGDLKYSGKKSKGINIRTTDYHGLYGLARINKVYFYLHAWKIKFLEHSIEAPLPQAFREKVDELFGGNYLMCNV